MAVFSCLKNVANRMDTATKKVTLTQGARVNGLTIDSKTAEINGVLSIFNTSSAMECGSSMGSRIVL